MRLKARAKINWTLDIVGQRADGYHLMDMLMQPVTLADDVVLTPADEITLTTGGSPLLPAFLQRVTDGLQKTVDGLARSGGETYEEYKQILEELNHVHRS